jgi:hypothetical protein
VKHETPAGHVLLPHLVTQASSPSVSGGRSTSGRFSSGVESMRGAESGRAWSTLDPSRLAASRPGAT